MVPLLLLVALSTGRHLRRGINAKDADLLSRCVRDCVMLGGSGGGSSRDGVVERLAAGSPWRAVYSLRPSGEGKFLSTGRQSFDDIDRKLTNEMRVGPLLTTFAGAFDIVQSTKGEESPKLCKMNISFETVQPKLFGVPLLVLDMSQGSMVRRAVERFVRGGKKTTSATKSTDDGDGDSSKKEFERRPNVYI